MTVHIVEEYQCYNVGTKCYQYTAVKVNLVYRRNYGNEESRFNCKRSTTDNLFCICQLLEKKWECII